jgi:Uri superfamily endonuclease
VLVVAAAVGGAGIRRHNRANSGDNGSVIPDVPGTYALVLACASARRVRIGRLGLLHLQPGYYVYIGSAFGTGGLRARISHHEHIAQRPRWHVDYLRRRARLEVVWYIAGARCEHEWAACIGIMPGAATPMLGFGSSDCDCAAHLFWFKDRPSASSHRLEAARPPMTERFLWQKS